MGGDNNEDVKQLSESPHTTHLSVIDSEGNTVSLTYTIESWFGSKIVVDGAGFLLNNEMGDFNPIPNKTDDEGNIGTEPNLVSPEKRTRKTDKWNRRQLTAPISNIVTN